jgi:hypothetical protein
MKLEQREVASKHEISQANFHGQILYSEARTLSSPSTFYVLLCVII